MLDNVDNFRDLGVVICNDLKFGVHCKRVVAQALKRVGLIFRAFSSRNMLSLVTAYKT